MKIKCQRQPFLKALQSINAIAVQRELNPILENARMIALENRLELKATDLKISITYTMPLEHVEIGEPGDLLVPVARLQSLVKEISERDIVLEQKGFNCVLICRDGHFTILGEDPAKFPEIPEGDGQASIKIAGEDFQKLIRQTLFATTTEKTRYDLDNVLVKIMGDTIQFVATDGKRLARCQKKCILVGNVGDVNLTVPARGLQQIEKVLSATTPPVVFLAFLPNQMLLSTEEVQLSTRLSDAKFPPYERVIPKHLPYKAKFALKDFASALKRVCLLADDKSKIVEFRFMPTVLKLCAVGEATGEGTVEIPITYDGGCFEIKFNPSFLLDLLRVAEGSDVEVCLQDGSTAALIKNGEDFEYLVLPIKVEDKDSDAEGNA